MWLLVVCALLVAVALASNEDMTGVVGKRQKAGPYRMARFRSGERPDP